MGQGSQADVPGTSSKLFELAYAESTRAITQQQSVLDNLRTRAGMIFSAGSVATAFLAGGSVSDGVPSERWRAGVIGIGIAFYLAMLFLTLWTLWPIDVVFSCKASVMLADVEDGWLGRPNDEVYGYLALTLEKQFETNQPKIDLRLTALQCAVVVLAIDVVAWIVVILGR